MFREGDVASRTEIEKKKLNTFSNFESVVRELCRISLYVIKRYLNASKLRTLNLD